MRENAVFKESEFRKFYFFSFIFMLAFTWQLFAQSEAIFPNFGSASYTAPFFPGGTYDPNIPEPSKFLGYPVGSRPARYSQVISYFETLAKSSPKTKLIEYGQTYEGRNLYYLLISSDDNLARLDQIKSSIAQLSDPRKISSRQAQNIIDNTPAIAWLAYSIHGDELSSTDAAIQVAYQLVAGTDALTERIRQSLIIVIDPLQNPDGRERFLTQVEGWNGTIPNPDVQSLEHAGFWPWGRGNHYLFDLNRDWFTLVHPETRGKLRAILEWNPQLFVDSHEMGPFSSYLFSPPREPFNPHMTSYIKKWWKTFASEQAQAFDKYGWSYYTREWNEEWYPGYGSSWSIYIGAIGILYEQAGVEGSLVKQKDASVLTYREAVHHHVVSSISNLTTAADNRKELLKDFYTEKKKNCEGSTEVKAYLFAPGNNSVRLNKFIERLLWQNIEVHQATAEFKADVSDFWGEKFSGKRFPKGTFIVFTNQPLRNLIKAILDFDIHMTTSSLEYERHELEKKKETSVYDVTAWSLPLAYNLETYQSKSSLNIKADKIAEIRPTEGKVVNDHPAYGYVFEAVSDQAPVALSKLLQAGFKVRVTRKPFQVEGTDFPQGGFLLRRNSNPSNLDAFILELSHETGLSFQGVNTALSQAGPDLGGDEFYLLEMPKVGVFSGPPVNFSHYGFIWHLLDQKLKLRFSALDINRVNQLDLDQYNLLVLPSLFGGVESYKHLFGKGGIEKLKNRIEIGGTLVTLGNASGFVCDTTVAISQVRIKEQVLGKLKEYEEALKLEERASKPPVDSQSVWGTATKKTQEATKSETPKEEKEPSLEELVRKDEWTRVFSPSGAFLRANLDPEHWLALGMGDKVPVIFSSQYAYLSKDPVQTVARLSKADSLRLSGLVWPEGKTRWAKTAYLTRESKGKGQVILFADDPNFRAYLLGTQRLFENAILLGPGIGTSQPTPW